MSKPKVTEKQVTEKQLLNQLLKVTAEMQTHAKRMMNLNEHHDNVGRDKDLNDFYKVAYLAFGAMMRQVMLLDQLSNRRFSLSSQIDVFIQRTKDSLEKLDAEAVRALNPSITRTEEE